MITEERYKKLCEACDSMLLTPGVSKERVAIPWLHVIREHPIGLAGYKFLFEESPQSGIRPSFRISSYLKKLVKQVSLILSSTSWWRSSHKNYEKVDILFVSHLLNSSHVGKEYDFYFADIPKKLEVHGITSAMALINHIPDTREMDLAWKTAQTQRFVLSESIGLFREFVLYISSLRESVKIRKEARRMESSLKRNVALHAAIEARNGSALYSLRIGRQVEKLIHKLNPTAVIVTFEGHAWERIVFADARKAKPGILCIGYQHAVIFRLQHAACRNLSPRFNPDVILTAGKRGFHSLVKAAMADVSIAILGSDRHVNTKNTLRDLSSPPTCLVLPEGEISECDILFKFSLICAIKLPDIIFIWRMHPVVNFEQLREHDSIFTKLPPNIILSTSSFEEDTARSRWTLYRGSTAAIQAECKGLKGIYLNRKGEMTIDPLYELTEWKTTVTTVDEFVEFVKSDPAVPPGSNLPDEIAAQKYCASFFNEIDVSPIIEILSTERNDKK